MKREQIAMVCHEVIRAYAIEAGEENRGPWANTTPEYQKSMIAGVDFNLVPEVISPAESHENWLKERLANGWTLGEMDEKNKTHPDMIPYHELPVLQRTKDCLFVATVTSMMVLAQEQKAAHALHKKKPPAPAKEVTVHVGKLPIKYIGKRPQYTDGTYSTGITWLQGETKMVPEQAAYRMLNHKDQYEMGIVEDSSAPEVKEPKSDEDETEDDLDTARDLIMSMNRKQALVDYAMDNFQTTLEASAKIKITDLQQKCIQLLDQYGLK